jgi:uncharacterized protein (UPF0332 family)
MKEALILYRQGKAKETLDDARVLLSAGSAFSALNRIYYAMFYEVLALLLTRDLSSAKHTGVRALFNEHFVKAGIVPVELGRLFSRMYDFRQKSDYGDFVTIQPEKVHEWLDQAETFIEKINEIIKNNLNAVDAIIK